MTSFSIVTQTHDRNDLLSRVLPSWLRLPAYEIVIIDHPGRESALSVVESCSDRRIRHLTARYDGEYNVSVMKNAAFGAARRRVVLYFDADIEVTPHFTVPNIDPDLPEAPFYQGRFAGVPAPGNNFLFDPAYGCIMLTRPQFNAVNGYDERMTGWGYEDTDFFRRLAVKYPRVCMPRGLSHWHHPKSMSLPDNGGANMDISHEKYWGPSDTRKEVNYETPSA